MKQCAFVVLATLALGLLVPANSFAQPPQGRPAAKKAGGGPVVNYVPANEVGIPWFATLDRGLAEAKRTGKPILFVSAAPHCAGVSGMW